MGQSTLPGRGSTVRNRRSLEKADRGISSALHAAPRRADVQVPVRSQSDGTQYARGRSTNDAKLSRTIPTLRRPMVRWRKSTLPPTFHDEAKEKTERENAFSHYVPARQLRQQRPAGLPDPSPLVDQAENLLAMTATRPASPPSPSRAFETTNGGCNASVLSTGTRLITNVRPSANLQAKYWRLWSIEVRCHRLAGQPEKAAELLATMDQRAASLHRDSDPVYWDALATLVRLYEEGNQKDRSASRSWTRCSSSSPPHPDPRRSAQLEDLRKLAAHNKCCLQA